MFITVDLHVSYVYMKIKYKNIAGPCGDRTHDIRVISTTL